MREVKETRELALYVLTTPIGNESAFLALSGSKNKKHEPGRGDFSCTDGAEACELPGNMGFFGRRPHQHILKSADELLLV